MEKPDDIYKRDVLDQGYVRLIDYMGSDLSVVRAARVSYDAAWRAGEDEGSDKKLLKSLWRRGHTTPFEVVTATFEVFAPIFVFRQRHRHRMQTYNELSARYRELPEIYFTPTPDEIGEQSKSSKQARVLTPIDVSVRNLREAEIEEYDAHCAAAFRLYRQLLSSGWPRELARGVLPLATYSHMFCTVDLMNLMKFLTLRCDEHAQREIRVYADAMVELIRPVAPICMEAWDESRSKK